MAKELTTRECITAEKVLKEELKKLPKQKREGLERYFKEVSLKTGKEMSPAMKLIVLLANRQPKKDWQKEFWQYIEKQNEERRKEREEFRKKSYYKPKK